MAYLKFLGTQLLRSYGGGKIIFALISVLVIRADIDEGHYSDLVLSFGLSLSPTSALVVQACT